VRPGRTIAVIDRTLTPTSTMLQTGAEAPDPALLEQAIAEQVGDGRVAFLDSTKIAELLLANSMLANVVLLGAAFQLGGLPVSLANVDRAMERQGRSAAANREAFEWGRWAVHEPAAIDERLAVAEAGAARDQSHALDPSAGALVTATSLVTEASLPEGLSEVLARRCAQVIDYQDAALGGRFVALVARAAATDDETRSWALTQAVADSWFKLLTYKDEYEVARLHLKVDYDHVASQLGIDGPYSVTYHLHPPTLRRLGRKTKLALGRPYQLSFHLLRRMRRLRGGPFDVFGWDPERRLERALLDEYRALVSELVDPGCQLPYEGRLELAASPMGIKGYGPIKVAAIERWRTSLAERRRAIELDQPLR
jgi:indolepyruvate ferredoxin oxidoreductase